MRVSRDCWKCEYEDCGWVWLAAGDESPEKCAKCRRRRWHTPGSEEVLQVGRVPRAKAVQVQRRSVGGAGAPAGCPSCGSLSGHQKWCVIGKAGGK